MLSLDLLFAPSDATHKAQIAGLSSGAGSYRLLLPPVPQNSTTVTNVNTSTGVITPTASFANTGLTVKFSTTGTLPAGLNAGSVYYVAGTSTFTLYNTCADAVAGTNNIVPTTAGTGTLTVTWGEPWAITAYTKSFTPNAQEGDKLTGTLMLKVTGMPSFPA